MNDMKLLHLGCHEILEFDELRLFTQIPGLEVFSPGAYINPEGIGGRPGVPNLSYKPEWLDAWSRVPMRPELPAPLGDQKASLTPELLEHFDAVMIHHVFGWVTENWPALEKWGGTVYYRDIGQTNFEQEQLLRYYVDRGMKIIRYSPKSRLIRNYAGEHALIRFSKDPSDFIPWVGDRKEIMTIGQSMQEREPACGYQIFVDSTRPFTRKLYGNNNQASGALWAGQLEYSQILEYLSWTRCYFYTGTYPAPYTLNFMEAAMAGCPIVSLDYSALPVHYDHYEVSDLMNSWGLGFWCGNSRHELEDRCVRTLSMTDAEARDRSNLQREEACKTFSYEAVKPLWKEIFKV